MNILPQITETITSMEVSEMIGKDHAHLMRDIQRYSEQFAESKIGSGDFFTESSYSDANQQKRPCYNITKKGCEFIAHKLTGTKGTAFTARYINRFHEMESELSVPVQLTAMQQIHILAQGNIELEQRVEATNHDLQDFKMDIPMFPVELDEVSNAARRKGIEVIGGKCSAAYSDRSLVGRVYKDIYREIHRQFGVESFKAIKRKDEPKAIEIIKNYQLPMALKNEIDATNSQMSLNIH